MVAIISERLYLLGAAPSMRCVIVVGSGNSPSYEYLLLAVVSAILCISSPMIWFAMLRMPLTRSVWRISGSTMILMNSADRMQSCRYACDIWVFVSQVVRISMAWTVGVDPCVWRHSLLTSYLLAVASSAPSSVNIFHLKICSDHPMNCAILFQNSSWVLIAFKHPRQLRWSGLTWYSSASNGILLARVFCMMDWLK